MTILIKELRKFEINDKLGKEERVRIRKLLSTHQHELRPSLLQYLSKYDPTLKTAEDATRRFIANIARNPEKLKMIYAIEPDSEMVVGVLHYTPKLDEESINHLLNYYPKSFNSHEQLENKTVLEYLMVHKDFRSLGIGKVLEETLIEKVKELNIDGIIVKTQSTNISAQEFYKKLGYAQIGEIVFPDMFRAEHGCPGEGSVWLGKRLKPN